MPRRYEKKIIPFQVVIRMPVEAVARCWHNNLTADDIRALAPGERMRPSTLTASTAGQLRCANICCALRSTGRDKDRSEPIRGTLATA
jgi:hypothetical protein